VNLESLKTGVRRDVPDLGEHSSEVLAEAGLTAEQIAKLRAKGALGGT
jgi:crotonobetainyl-CoA:carnitine CoA-transferase CaiB-like acyl-CoA transferase